MGSVSASTLPIDQKGTPALYSDTLANRPAAGFTGRLFVAIDTFALYRDNGATWDLIGGPGTGTITGTGTVDTYAIFTNTQEIGDGLLAQSGTTLLFNGNAVMTGGGGSIIGNPNEVAFFSASNVLDGNANFLYDAVTGLFSVNANNNDTAVRFTQNNAAGYLMALNDGTNDVVIVDHFGTIYASALAAYLTFANVYAGGFVNDDPLGKGLQIQGGSLTTQSFLVSNYDDTIDMLEIFQDRILLGVRLESAARGLFGVAEIGSWSLSATSARFGHTTYEGSSNQYGFLQESNGDVYIAGDLISLNSNGNVEINQATNTMTFFYATRNVAINSVVDNGNKFRVNGSIYSDTNIESVGYTKANNFNSVSGNINVPNATVTTLFSLPATGAGLFYIYAYVVTGDPNNYASYIQIALEGGVARVLTTNNAGILLLSLSGLNVQASQNSGSNAFVAYSYIRQL